MLVTLLSRLHLGLAGVEDSQEGPVTRIRRGPKGASTAKRSQSEMTASTAQVVQSGRYWASQGRQGKRNSP